jgi:hypothetical protein
VATQRHGCALDSRAQNNFTYQQSMFKLQVQDFSCLSKADICFGRMSVLIGPQASGKSVLSKLAFFFLELMTDQYESILDQKSFDHFTESIKVSFSEWFPVAAWGKKKFTIQFALGEYKIKITRTTYDDSVKDTLRISTSALVKDHFKRTAELAKTFRQKSAKRSNSPYLEFELNLEVQAAATSLLQKDIGADFIAGQTFIPAGRSFFTTLGRAFMAFDQGRGLDPITVKFGRLYSAFHEENRMFSRGARPIRIDAELGAILGGSIVWEADRPYLHSEDGRTVPFSALSSGQQELLPLVVAISTIRRTVSRRESWTHLLYIEEPEAHLFPSAQSKMIQGLASLVSDPARRLSITTHSPYVLSKINNLIKAGQLADALPQDKQSRLESLVPKIFRLQPQTVQAYAIIDTEVRNILDDDGLIAADYLDSVSGEIGQQFGDLLALEFGE